jgi:deoxyribodipyrimidine photo-lyase
MARFVWFKRDLRVEDQSRAGLAAARGRCCRSTSSSPGSGRSRTPRRGNGPLRPSAWRTCATRWRSGGAAGAAHRRGGGGAGGALRAHGITRIVSHEETGNALDLCPRPAGGRPGRAARGWSGTRCRSRAWCAGCQPRRLGGAARRLPARAGVPTRRRRSRRCGGWSPGRSPRRRAWLPPDPCPGRQRGGRRRGLAALEAFLTSRGRGLSLRAMSSPLTGERPARGFRRIWPGARFRARGGGGGGRAAGRAKAGGGWAASLKSFEARLAWRDHFMQKLEDAPDLETAACIRPTRGCARATRCGAAGGLGAGETGCPSSMPACAIWPRPAG